MAGSVLLQVNSRAVGGSWMPCKALIIDFPGLTINLGVVLAGAVITWPDQEGRQGCVSRLAKECSPGIQCGCVQPNTAKQQSHCPAKSGLITRGIKDIHGLHRSGRYPDAVNTLMSICCPFQEGQALGNLLALFPVSSEDSKIFRAGAVKAHLNDALLHMN